MADLLKPLPQHIPCSAKVIIKLRYTLKIKVTGLNLRQLSDIAEAHNCDVYPGDKDDEFEIWSADPVNFFWLGFNWPKKSE